MKNLLLDTDIQSTASLNIFFFKLLGANLCRIPYNIDKHCSFLNNCVKNTLNLNSNKFDVT